MESNQSQPLPSETAVRSRDSYGLGQTAGQRGAEILAGLRAERMPSPITQALSRMSGRIIARLLMRMLKTNKPLNYVMARPLIFEHLIRQSLPEDRSGAVIVEAAAGMSPRGILLAQQMPEVRIIEVDLPEVVEDKQRRLKQHREVTIPDNITWRSADLGVTPLTEVLGDEKADVLVSEGLLGYLHYDQIRKFARWAHESLKPGGVFIGDMGLRQGIEVEAQEVSGFFSRQAGKFHGLVETVEEGNAMFKEAGFGKIDSTLPLELVDELNLPTPNMNMAYYVQAHKAKIFT